MCDAVAKHSDDPGLGLSVRPLGHYEFVRPIKGGLSGSKVCIARNKKSGRQVVIKSDSLRVLRPEIVADCMTSRVGVEARRMFPAVVDVGISDGDNPEASPKGSAFLVMELVGGVTLEEYLAGKLPPVRHALSVLFQIAFALREIRKNFGLRHCDVHARNVIVDAADPHGETSGRFVVSGRKKKHAFDLSGCPKVRIIDFGLAQRRKSRPRHRSFSRYLLRLYQMYLRPKDITRVNLKLNSGLRVSTELLAYMRSSSDVCENYRSDVEGILGFEDVLVSMYGMDEDAPAASRIPSPGAKPPTYYQILTSGRFDALRKNT
eukprot:jgi/Tetstr1/464070/TSEL_008875.t1